VAEVFIVSEAEVRYFLIEIPNHLATSESDLDVVIALTFILLGLPTTVTPHFKNTRT
jgi:hypothetical protein